MNNLVELGLHSEWALDRVRRILYRVLYAEPSNTCKHGKLRLTYMTMMLMLICTLIYILNFFSSVNRRPTLASQHQYPMATAWDVAMEMIESLKCGSDVRHQVSPLYYRRHLST